MAGTASSGLLESPTSSTFRTSDSKPRPQPARLYALGDLHISHQGNALALKELRPHPGCGLILAGDIGESLAHLHTAFETATACFARVWWVPGNHELYTLPTSFSSQSTTSSPPLRGVAKYLACVQVARQYGVLTPEDEYVRWEGSEGGPVLVAPIFTLYDYSFRPEDVNRAGALDWARADNGTEATDEVLLHADPYGSRDEWCHALVEKTEIRLKEVRAREPSTPLVLVNHWPLREDLVYIPRIPRFSLWCGTKLTEDWHRRFVASVVVTGHLHVRRTDWKDGCRFEEVSLGYPRQWADAKDCGKDVNDMMRIIWPGTEKPTDGDQKTVWRRFG